MHKIVFTLFFQPKYAKRKPPDMLHMLSMWDRNYRVNARTALHEKQLPERPSVKGKELTVKRSVKKRSPVKRVREGNHLMLLIHNNHSLAELLL